MVNELNEKLLDRYLKHRQRLWKWDPKIIFDRKFHY